jgi:hypothetical protein
MVRTFRLMLVLLYIYINSTNIPPNMIINRIYGTQNLLSLVLFSFPVGLRTYQHPGMKLKYFGLSIRELSSSNKVKKGNKTCFAPYVVLRLLESRA